MGGILQHALFRFKLGLAIDIDRIGLICLLVPTTLAVEYFPARQEDKGNVPGESSQISRGVHIHTTGYLRISLALCRSTYSRAVDDCVGLETLPNLFGCGVICEIKVSAAEAMDLPSGCPSSSGLHEVLPYQSCGPGDDDTWLHSASMRKAPRSNRIRQAIQSAGRCVWCLSITVRHRCASTQIENGKLYDFRLLVWKM